MFIVELIAVYMKHGQKIGEKILDSCVCEPQEVDNTSERLVGIYGTVESQYNNYHKFLNDGKTCLLYATPKEGNLANCITRASIISDDYSKKIMNCSKIQELNSRRARKS